MGKQESDQHRIGFERGVKGEPEYKWSEFLQTGTAGEARHEGYNEGREERLSNEAAKQSNDK